jgi:hypothetical protein
MNTQNVESTAIDVLKHQKYHLPQTVIIGGDGKINIIAMPIEDESSKQQVINALRRLVSDFKSESYYVILEAWITMIDKEHNKSNKTEALVINHVQKGKPLHVIINKFSKTESGDIVITDREDITSDETKEFSTIWDVFKEDANELR